MTLQNMKSELAIRNINLVDVAERMGFSGVTLLMKLDEYVPMTLWEARAIHDRWLADVPFDDVTRSDGHVPTLGEVAELREKTAGTRDCPGLSELGRLILDDLLDEQLAVLDAEIARRHALCGVRGVTSCGRT